MIYENWINNNKKPNTIHISICRGRLRGPNGMWKNALCSINIVFIVVAATLQQRLPPEAPISIYEYISMWICMCLDVSTMTIKCVKILTRRNIQSAWNERKTPAKMRSKKRYCVQGQLSAARQRVTRIWVSVQHSSRRLQVFLSLRTPVKWVVFDYFAVARNYYSFICCQTKRPSDAFSFTLARSPACMCAVIHLMSAAGGVKVLFEYERKQICEGHLIHHTYTIIKCCKATGDRRQHARQCEDPK